MFSKHTKEEDMIKQYIRNNKNRRVGVMIGLLNSAGTLIVGFSKCSPRDKFDKEYGEALAVQRAVLWNIRGRTTEDFHNEALVCFKDQLDEFVERCKRYYKNSPTAAYLQRD